MRTIRNLFLFVLLGALVGATSLQAQDYTINFIKGAKEFKANSAELKDLSQLDKSEVFNQRFYRFIQFNAIPTVAEQAEIAATGIKLLEYIPNNVYVASIPTNIDFGVWADLGIRSLMPIEYTQKIGQRLEDADYPHWAMDGKRIIVSIQYYQDINAATIVSALQKRNVEVTESMHHAQILVAKLLPNQIEKLAKSPFIRYVDIMSEPGQPESDDGRHLHRANAIDGDYTGARNYDGTGITFAINDDGYVGPHIDFTGRLNQQDVAGDFTGTHGDMTTGIAGGAGNLDPLMRGMATGSYIHVRQYVSSMAGTIALHQDSAVMIFSSSYSNGCNGGYTNTTVLVDQEIYNNPSLMQTFSAGNSNNQNCGYGAGNQWGNVTGGHKIGKNVIATANLDNQDIIRASSSRGPASDGRIKPDISAHGHDQMSTDPDNSYAPGGGTSAAAPGICGVMAQLYHAYSDLNAGATAPSALMKVAMLATANDLGNDGPDFIYGWGKVNGLKAVKLLEENRYLSSSISQGGSNTHNITIPAGVQRAKIMVYWADKEASTSASTALVNDLDCTVSDTGSTVYMPWVLDHTPNATTLALPATKGADHLNNVEQIAIDNPTAGVYTLDITGTTIPFGSQEYYVVYEFLMDDITVVHPMGGEGLIPGTQDRIHWDAYGTTGTFNIEWSSDGGGSWSTISSNVSGASRFINWTVPSTITGQGKVRITRGTASDESDANFTIITRPQNIRINRVCPSISSIQVAWDSVPGATSYDVFMLGQKYMDSVGTSTGFYLNVPVANVNDAQWFSVRAVGTNGIRGLRQIAVNYPGSAGGSAGCYLSCSGDNDAGVRSIDNPVGSLEPCGGTSSTPITATIENKGLFTETNFPVSYKLATGAIVTETFTGSLASGATASYTFATAATIPAPGTYTLQVWTGLSADSTICNDTITSSITVLASVAVFPYVETFQAVAFPPSQGFLTNPDNDRTWEASAATLIGANGSFTKAMYVNNFSYNASGEEDFFTTVSMDLTTGSAAQVTFDVAYREYSSTYSDDLRVDISTDCGANYSQIYLKGGQTLATGANATSSWSPNSANDWRNESIDLTSYIGSHIILRWVNLCGYGNNLYVDNINVDLSPPLGLDPIANTFNLDVLPNPTKGETTINLNETLTEDLGIEVVGMNGKVLFQSTLMAGESNLSLDLSKLPAAIYLLRLRSSQMVDVRKITVTK